MDHLQIDIDKLQQIQDSFCETAGVFAFCVDEDGKKLTHLSGKIEEARIVMACINSQKLADMLGTVMASRVENQIIESNEDRSVLVSCISNKIKNVPVINWIVYAAVGRGGQLSNVSTITTRDSFINGLNLLKMGTNTMLLEKYESLNAQLESQRSHSQEAELQLSLKKSRAMADIIRYMESSAGIEEIIDGVLTVAGKCIELSNAFVFRPNFDDTADIIGEYVSPDAQNMFEGRMGVMIPEFAENVERTVAISSDSKISSDMRTKLYRHGIEAVVMVPIQVNGKNAMTACYLENRRMKSWSKDEIQFLVEISHIIQDILFKRIQQNSLASSYVSLERILDNVGCGIFVRDVENGGVLFSNKILRKMFELDEKEALTNNLFLQDFVNNTKNYLPEQDDLSREDKPIHSEVNDAENSKWYDVWLTRIKWVDGKRVQLFSFYDITDKKSYQTKIEQQANNDFLTGLYNRMCCEKDLQKHIASCSEKGTKGLLLYLDLDDFKHINDGLGHQYGDVLLRAISHAFTRIKGIENSCYRMGGDEFVVIVSDQYYHQKDRIFDEMKDIFRKPWFLKGADYYCTMSMGVVTFPDEGGTVQDLIRKADIAMYEAKRSGKNKISYFSSGSDSLAFQRLGMEKNMRAALSTEKGYEEFEVYYQPIVDVTKPGIPCVGAEALLRWNNSELGFISPADFIPLAEYLGLINPIGDYVLRKACESLKYWNDHGHPEYKVNVNLSVVQLLQENIVETIEQTILETGINPANLTLEVTESLAINDMARMKGILARIRSLGARIALDDFGTGYSSLNHIREIPLDVIKVDQSFVRDLAVNQYSQSFIKMVAELAQTLDVNVCVEGIENTEQLNVIKDMKISMIQGYYFGKPMQLRDFEVKYL